MATKKLTRRRVFEIIQIGQKEDVPSRVFDFIIVGLILINMVIAICFTFDELMAWRGLFNAIEAVTVACFMVELALRLWTADYLYQGKGRAGAAVRYLFSFNGIVEVLSIVPFFLPFVFPTGAIAFRMFRVVRILRLFQANSYSDALSTIIIVLRRKRNQILSSLLIIFVIMVMSSLVMYGFEHQAQPEVFSNAFSGIWWSVSTLLTIGYGDIYPVTIWGQIASIVITFLGVGMVAIPTGILSAGFIEYTGEQKATRRKKRKANYCPNCGEELPE